MRNFILLYLSVSLLPAFAHADSLKTDGKLTESVIQSFYKMSADIHHQSYAEYEAFTKAHTSDDVAVTMNNITLLDNQAPQTGTITLNKTQMLKDLPDDYKGVQDMKIDQKVNSIKIAADGKTAIVKDTTVLTGDMPLPGKTKAPKVGVQSQSLCEDTVTLNAENEPQVSKSTCTTKTKITTK